MFSLNFSSYPIGLDISDLSLKLIQLNKSGHDITIQAAGKLDLPVGLMNDGYVGNQEDLVKAIRKLISDPQYGKVTSNRVVACLPDSKTFLKLIKVDKGPNELADVIESEMEKHIPFAVEDVYYDWQVMEENGQEIMVLIGAAPKDLVNQYTSLFEKAHLSVEALEIEPLVLCRCLLREEAPDYKGAKELNYAVLDIGATHTSLAFYSRDTLLFTMQLPLTGEGITDEIAKTLNLKKDQAEKAKLICGLDDEKADGVVKEVLAGVMENLGNKMKEAMEYYQNRFAERGPINQILLCGGGANIIGLSEVLSKATGIETARGDSLINFGPKRSESAKIMADIKKIGSGSMVEKAKKNSSKESTGKKNKSIESAQSQSDCHLTMATAIGLALRSIFIDDL